MNAASLQWAFKLHIVSSPQISLPRHCPISLPFNSFMSKITPMRTTQCTIQLSTGVNHPQHTSSPFTPLNIPSSFTPSPPLRQPQGTYCTMFHPQFAKPFPHPPSRNLHSPSATGVSLDMALTETRRSLSLQGGGGGGIIGLTSVTSCTY